MDILQKILLSFCLALFCFAIPCDAQIKVNITIASGKRYVLVNYTGFDNKLITDREVTLFNITINNLNKGVRLELGKVPDNIFLKDPTPYYNLFEKYKWPQVQRHLFIKQATVLDVIHQQVVVKTIENINDSNVTQKCKKSLTEQVEFTKISFWSEEGIPRDDIANDVCIDFLNKRKCFINKWRESNYERIRETLGVKHLKGLIDIKPGQTIVSKLIANKTITFIELQYSAKLIGNIILDYDRLYGKYHFYSPSIHNIMKAGFIPNEIITTERIEIRGYTDPKMFVYDKETGQEIILYRRIKLTGSEKKRRIVYLDD